MDGPASVMTRKRYQKLHILAVELVLIVYTAGRNGPQYRFTPHHTERIWEKQIMTRHYLHDGAVDAGLGRLTGNDIIRVVHLIYDAGIGIAETVIGMALQKVHMLFYKGRSDNIILNQAS